MIALQKLWKCFLFNLKNSFRSSDIQIFAFLSSPLFPRQPLLLFRDWSKINLKFWLWHSNKSNKSGTTNWWCRWKRFCLDFACSKWIRWLQFSISWFRMWYKAKNPIDFFTAFCCPVSCQCPWKKLLIDRKKKKKKKKLRSAFGNADHVADQLLL